MPTAPLDPKAVIAIDGYLEPNIPSIEARHEKFRKWKDTIEQHEGGYENFTKGYLKFGFNVGANGEVVYREWAPNARSAHLIGDFSTCWLSLITCTLQFIFPLDNWDRTAHKMTRDPFGVWEIVIPPTSAGVCAIPHDSKVKVQGYNIPRK